MIKATTVTMLSMLVATIKVIIRVLIKAIPNRKVHSLNKRVHLPKETQS